MIPITTILTEIAGVVTSVEGITFRSTETGYVREVVPVTAMPACDIMAGDHSSQEYAGYTDYSLPIIIVLRRQAVKPTSKAAALDQWIEDICGALESHAPVAFDRIGPTASQKAEEPGGDGSIIRIAVITCTALYHD